MEKKTKPKKSTTTTKVEKTEKNLRFSFKAEGGDEDRGFSPQALTQDLRSNLSKSVRPLKITKESRNKVGESKVAFGLKGYMNSTDNVEVKSYTRLSDAELGQLALLDPYVSAIIATRCSQSAACGIPSESKFKKGLRLVDLNQPQREMFESEESFHATLLSRTRKMRAIENWVLNCGTTDQEILDSVFAKSDRTFKYCSLRQYIEAQVRNLLTFGRIATQVMRDAHGVPALFRPLPVETIAPVIDREEISLTRREEQTEASLEDGRDYNALPENERPSAWVQRIDGQNVGFFTEDDLKVAYYQKQALFDLNGYPLAPLEMAVFMVYVHQQTLAYLKNQFVKGLATKGMINLQSTNENVQLSDADVEDFKQQFHNFVTRTDNSAVTPVIGGPVKVDYIALSTTPKDMEFLQVEEHVIRALCSAFQISPHEMGYGHLSLPQGGISQSNKQEEIIKGEERGLRNLLDIVFDGINQIVFENFPEARDQFRVSYVGIGEDTRDAVAQRQTVEINTTATMASLFSDSEKKDQIGIGGNVPLAPIFHANVVKYLKYWEFRYYFLGDKEAKGNKAYDFIIDPNLNQAYQGLAVQSLEMQKEQAKLGLVQQEEQTKQVQIQGKMMEQQANADPNQMAAQAQPGADGGQPPPQQEGGQAQDGGQAPEQTEKSVQGPSLRERYLAKSEDLQKTEQKVSSYFAEWLKANGQPITN